MKSPAHKQERALVTRDQLMKAAREIFTRDGFESARIEDIASRARKTRGAFYDNFADKEDVFFAIFEEDIARDQSQVVEAMASAANIDERIAILATHFEKLLQDRQRLLLGLEFKMYVIRHPQKRKRLTELYAEMCVRCSITKVNTLFPELKDAPLDKRRTIAMELAIIFDGLSLNSLFNPDYATGERCKRYLRIAAEQAVGTMSQE